MVPADNVLAQGGTKQVKAVSKQHHDISQRDHIIRCVVHGEPAAAHPHSLVELAQGDEQSQRSLLLGPGLRVVQHGMGKQRRLNRKQLSERSCLHFLQLMLYQFLLTCT